MGVVDSGPAVRVDAGWWSQPDPAAMVESLPFAGLDFAVVVPAEQPAVDLIGPATLTPRPEVVDLTPGGRASAAGPGAAAVPDLDAGSRGAGVEAAFPAEVDGLAVGVEDRRDQAGVAGQHPGERGADLRPVVEDTHAGPVGEGGQRDGDPDLGFPTIPGGGGRVAQEPAADLDDRVVASLARAAPVLLPVRALRERCGQSVEGGGEDGVAGGVVAAADQTTRP